MEELEGRIKELKKSKFDVEGIKKKANNLPAPDEDSVFVSTPAIQRNVVFLGKSGVGKTTCFEVLKDASYCTPRGHSLLASAVLDTVYTPLVVHNAEGKSYSINIIDTPGLFEVRTTSTSKRSNEEILHSITDCIRGSITSISCVFIVVPFTSVLNQEDLQALIAIQEFLGTSEIVKSKVYLIFSKSDAFQLENLGDRLNEFLESDISKTYLEFCRGGIYFTGAISGESVLEYGEMYASKVKRKVVCLRQCLIDAILTSEPVPISKFAISGNKSEESHSPKEPREKVKDREESEKKPKSSSKK